jgi:subtilisin family serine protease
MRMLGMTLAALVAITAATASGDAAAAAAGRDELIVRFERGVDAAERAAIRHGAGTVLERPLPVRGMQLVQVDRGSLGAARRALAREEGVLYAEPNASRRLFMHPNDPLFPLLWAMENTGQSVGGATGAADADTDAADAWDADVTGGVLVAVLDSGLDFQHPDLAENIWRNPGETGSGRESNGVDDDLNGRVDDWRGWDFVGGDNDPADENGHGTHVAGTIGARRDNGLGVAGIADGSTLMAVRAFDAQGSATLASVIQGYAYAVQEGAQVVNMSFGSGSSSLAERDAIAAHPDVLFVAAAGNGGADHVGDDNDLSLQFPCAYPLPNIVCVAASDNRDGLAPFSNYGDLSVDLAAPGVSILSTAPGGGYAFADGTSMATPHVSGAAALAWAAAPGKSALDIRSALLQGVDPRPAFAGRTVTGGRLNALRALEVATGVTVPPENPPPGGSPGPPAPGAPAPGPTTQSDRVPPGLTVRVARRQRLRKLLRRGLRVRLRSSEDCSVRLRLRVGRRVVATIRPAPLDDASSSLLVADIRPRARARLRARVPTRATLVVVATDDFGNRRSVTVRLRIRR